MTHERTAGDEAPGGPQNDDRLPDAASIPVSDGPFDLPPVLHEDEWDTEGMTAEYAAELAAAVVLGLTPAEED